MHVLEAEGVQGVHGNSVLSAESSYKSKAVLRNRFTNFKEKKIRNFESSSVQTRPENNSLETPKTSMRS